MYNQVELIFRLLGERGGGPESEARGAEESVFFAILSPSPQMTITAFQKSRSLNTSCHLVDPCNSSMVTFMNLSLYLLAFLCVSVAPNPLTAEQS